MKALVEADGERILGFAMIGADAGEVMAVVQTAMLAGMPYTGLRDAVIAHPTMQKASTSSFRMCRPLDGQRRTVETYVGGEPRLLVAT